jgi:hypothetical protein
MEPIFVSIFHQDIISASILIFCKQQALTFRKDKPIRLQKINKLFCIIDCNTNVCKIKHYIMIAYYTRLPVLL